MYHIHQVPFLASLSLLTAATASHALDQGDHAAAQCYQGDTGIEGSYHHQGETGK